MWNGVEDQRLILGRMYPDCVVVLCSLAERGEALSEGERAELARLRKALKDPRDYRIKQTLFMGK